MSKEAMKLALEALGQLWLFSDEAAVIANPAITALREALAEQPAQQEFVSPGGGYVPAIPAQQALDKKAENARELGLDYEPLAGTQVSKVWWDGEKLMAKPIPFVEFYKPAQQQEPLEYWNAVEGWVKIDEVRQHFDSVGCGTIYKTPGDGRVPLTTAQRTWVGLTHEDFQAICKNFRISHGGWIDMLALEIEAKLKEKNT